MKIVVAADLHYGVGYNQEICHKLVQRILKKKPDVIILAGDTFHFDFQLLTDCLELFKDFKGDKMLVPGNHDLWTEGGNSLELYEKTLPNIIRQAGFHYLDEKPFIKENVAFVGNIGWYDFTFKDLTRPIPQEFYEKKYWPGAIIHNDGRYVHLGITDEEFTRRLNTKLKKHLAQVSKNPKVDTIICTFHHVPFKQLQHSHHTSMDRFLTAFSGSRETGEICLSFPKVKYVFCGHTHQKKKALINGVHAINVGSDYLRKRFEVLEI